MTNAVADKVTGYGTGRCLCGGRIPKGDNWCSDECYLPWLAEYKKSVFGEVGHLVEKSDKNPDIERSRTEKSDRRFCQGCTVPIDGLSLQAKFCSDACRKKVSRG